MLIAAPTGSGKTFAAFLAAIDRPGARWARRPRSPDETQIVYVSPLKALSNDINRNLEAPLDRHRRRSCARWGCPRSPIRTFVRTGDTPQSERAQRAAQSAAHPGDDAGVALHPAGLGVGAQHARDHAHGDRRRNPCARRQQARRASGAVARAARSARRSRSGRVSDCRRRRSRSRKSRAFWSAAPQRSQACADCTIVDSGHVAQSRSRASKCRRRRSKR